MEIIKRKILTESLICREEGINYNVMTADTFNINIFLTQTIEDMGMFTDSSYFNDSIIYPLTVGGSPNINNPLVAKLIESGYTFNFMYSAATVTTPLNVSDYYAYGTRISAATTSRLVELKKYRANNPYEQMFIFNPNVYTDYQGISVSGVSTIFDMASSGYTGYSFDTINDTNLGTLNQFTGLLFRDTGKYIAAYDNELNARVISKKAMISYMAQGWNVTNISLSGNIKDEVYLGITSNPEVQSEVFIDRGQNAVLEPHLRLSEIESLEHLENYSNGSYYNIEKQTI